MHQRQRTDAFRRLAGSRRTGVAATELAVILPLLAFLFVLTVDFGRVFYPKFIVVSAARCGALYGSTNPTCAQDTAGIRQKVRAEAQDLDPLLLQIDTATATDSAGHPCIVVTVTYPFHTITGYLVNANLQVAGRTTMRVGPVLPTFN